MSNAAKLSVIHVVSSLNVGGAERFVIDLCQEQTQQHMDNAILSFGSEADALVNVCHENQIPLYVVGGKSWRVQRKRLTLLSRFDVIHIHSPAALKSLIFHLFFLRHKKLIYTRHGAAPLNKPHWRRVHSLARNFIDCVTFVSAEAKQNFSHHAWHKTPQHVIDNGVKMPGVLTAPIQQSVLNLGSVGRMIPLKSQISLLKAVSQLPLAQQQKLALHFFGDGELRQTLELFSKEHVKAPCHFYGLELDRHRIYPALDALVVTSSTEGLSMVILEAMAFAKPVIATAVGGNPVLVKPEYTGWLYAFDDVTELQQIIQTLLAQPEQLTQRGLAGRQWVSEHYSLSQTAKRYLDLYRD